MKVLHNKDINCPHCTSTQIRKDGHISFMSKVQTSAGVKPFLWSEVKVSEDRTVTAQQMLRVTQSTVSKLIGDGKFVIALGGEHSITVGVVEACRQAYPDELA